jgi:hypothetical protein
MANDTFVCARCGQEFFKAWPDAEMLKEMNRAFPGLTLAMAQLVCDPCWTPARVYRARQNWLAGPLKC